MRSTKDMLFHAYGTHGHGWLEAVDHGWGSPPDAQCLGC